METNSDSPWNFTPRHLLIGHTAPVKCIAKANSGSESHYAVTSSENGEMFIWDTVDGRCIENKQIPGLIHTSIQVRDVQKAYTCFKKKYFQNYRKPPQQIKYLFCHYMKFA